MPCATVAACARLAFRADVREVADEDEAQEIARTLGVAKKTIQNDIGAIKVDTPIHVQGEDGKSYPAAREPKAEPEQRRA